VPKRELANILLPTISRDFTIIIIVQNNTMMNMDVNIPKERLAISSFNNSKALSIHSNVSSILYHKRMKIQSLKLTWDKQVEISKKENFSLSYATSKVGEEKMADEIIDHNSEHGEKHDINKAATSNNTVNPQGVDKAINNSNICMPQDIETTLIPYEENCSMELNV